MRILLAFIMSLLCLQLNAQETVPLKLYEKLENEKEQLEKELEGAKETIKNQQTEITDLTEEVRSLNENQAKSKSEIRDLSNELKELKEKVKTLKEENEKLLRGNDEVQAELDSLLAKKATSGGTIESLREQLADKDEQIEELQDKLANLEELHNNLKNSTEAKKVDELSEQLKENKSECKKKLKDKDEQIRSLTSKVAAYGSIKELVDKLSVSTRDEVGNFIEKIDKFLEDARLDLNKQPRDAYLEEIDFLIETADLYISFLEDDFRDLKEDSELLQRNYFPHLKNSEISKQ